MIVDFGKNYTLAELKSVLEDGRATTQGINITSFKVSDKDVLVFDGIAHTYAEWKAFFNVKNETNDGQQD